MTRSFPLVSSFGNLMSRWWEQDASEDHKVNTSTFYSREIGKNPTPNSGINWDYSPFPFKNFHGKIIRAGSGQDTILPSPVTT